MMLLLRTFAPLVLLLSPSRPAGAGAAVDTTPLQFHGFRAGASLGELQALVRTLDGGQLRCLRAKADPRVTECRATVSGPDLGQRVSLWVSAIDSVAGVITLSGPVGADQLDRWRQAIERRYGRVDATAQGPQWMMQWVRRGRMLRLTWRIERGAKTASVSLVDGRVLDDWGRSRGQPASRTR